MIPPAAIDTLATAVMVTLNSSKAMLTTTSTSKLYLAVGATTGVGEVRRVVAVAVVVCHVQLQVVEQS